MIWQTLLPKITIYPLFSCALILGGSPHSQAQTLGLFDSDEPLEMTLSGNLRPLLTDHTPSSKVFQLSLAYSSEKVQVSIPIEVKQRGHFRRFLGDCTYPPLYIKFPQTGTHLNSIFKDQQKMKLVMPCKGDEYVIREWLVYKLYNLISPYSFRVRLVRLTLQDEQQKKQPEPFYTFLLEEDHQLAQRHQMATLDRKLKPYATQAEHFLRMAVFEYLIANTDWSVEYLQNVKLLAPNTKTIPIPVPYDFDHAGIVAAPYARPVEELELASLQQRRYRGYCLENKQQFEPVIAHFNALKAQIYATYTQCSLLTPKYIKSTVAFLDDFYTTINNPQKWQREFAYPCDPSGTGSVVVKGLRE